MNLPASVTAQILRHTLSNRGYTARFGISVLKPNQRLEKHLPRRQPANHIRIQLYTQSRPVGYIYEAVGYLQRLF